MKPRLKESVLPLLKGIGLAATGTALCLTIVGLPVGIPLVLMSGRPLGKVCKQWVEEDTRRTT